MNEELRKEIQSMIMEALGAHQHTGIDGSRKLDGAGFKDTPFTALTAKNADPVADIDGAITDNNRTRIEEIENILKSLNILPN